jgi:hypothetical protein
MTQDTHTHSFLKVAKNDKSVYDGHGSMVLAVNQFCFVFYLFSLTEAKELHEFSFCWLNQVLCLLLKKESLISSTGCWPSSKWKGLAVFSCR